MKGHRLLALALCVALALSGTASCLAEETRHDFIFLDELSWSMKLDEAKDLFGLTPEISEVGGMNLLMYNDVFFSELGEKGTVTIFYGDREAGPFLVVMAVSVDVSLFENRQNEMEKTYNKLRAAGESTYSDRSELLFTSTEEMIRAYDNKDDFSPLSCAFMDALITIITDEIKNMYDTDNLNCITNAEAWLVDGHNGAAILYSGQRSGDTEVIAVYSNFASINSSIGAISGANADSSTRFILPDGVNWLDERSDVLKALGDTSTMESNGSIFARYNGDDYVGNLYSICEYKFDDANRLFAVYHTVTGESGSAYQDIIGELTKDLGEPVEDMEQKKNLFARFGVEDGVMWFTSDGAIVMCWEGVSWYGENDPCSYVLSFPLNALMG